MSSEPSDVIPISSDSESDDSTSSAESSASSPTSVFDFATVMHPYADHPNNRNGWLDDDDDDDEEEPEEEPMEEPEAEAPATAIEVPAPTVDEEPIVSVPVEPIVTPTPPIMPTTSTRRTPSFRTFRTHPGGPLRMFTPRKTVNPHFKRKLADRDGEGGDAPTIDRELDEASWNSKQSKMEELHDEVMALKARVDVAEKKVEETKCELVAADSRALAAEVREAEMAQQVGALEGRLETALAMAVLCLLLAATAVRMGALPRHGRQ